MNKAALPERIKSIFLFWVIGCLFFVSCGLDDFIYVEPPVASLPLVSYENSEEAGAYFSFKTCETGQKVLSGFTFTGTEVYYKIYNNVSAMEANEAKVKQLLSSSSANSFYFLTNSLQSDGLGYNALGTDNGGSNLFLSCASPYQDRSVYIRLTDLDSDLYRAAVCVEKGPSSWDKMSYDSTVALPFRPCRNGRVAGSFNFGGDNLDVDKVPVQGDPDVWWSDEATEDGVWYVDMYAVSTGQDQNFTQITSQVVFLGSIKISEGSTSSPAN